MNQADRKELREDIATAIAPTATRVDSLHTKVDLINGSVAKMPGKWGEAIATAIGDCRRDRNEISHLVESAEEKGRAEAERARLEAERNRRSGNSYAPRSSRLRLPSWVQPLIPYILAGLAFLGLWAMNRGNGDTDTAALVKAVQTIQAVQRDVSQIKKTTDVIDTAPPPEQLDPQTFLSIP